MSSFPSLETAVCRTYIPHPPPHHTTDAKCMHENRLTLIIYSVQADESVSQTATIHASISTYAHKPPTPSGSADTNGPTQDKKNYIVGT